MCGQGQSWSQLAVPARLGRPAGGERDGGATGGQGQQAAGRMGRLALSHPLEAGEIRKCGCD